MMRYLCIRQLFSIILCTLALGLTACGGGDGEGADHSNSQGTLPDVPNWPQALTFTDFIGSAGYFHIAGSGHTGSANNCQLCISVYGVAQSSAEMNKLLPDWKTSAFWPVPYNDKLFSELPIDYNNKTAVVLEDPTSGDRYRYTMQKVEESADTVSISVLKCMVFEAYQNSGSVKFGLLIPKTTKLIQVLTVQSGKPTLPVYEPNGLGAC